MLESNNQDKLDIPPTNGDLGIFDIIDIVLEKSKKITGYKS